MSDKPYEKECLFCKQKIRMSKETGKWLPYNLNNGPHECRKKEKQQAIDTIKEIEQNNNNKQNHKVITWEMVQKKLASIGIVIDVEKLLRESDYIQ